MNEKPNEQGSLRAVAVRGQEGGATSESERFFSTLSQISTVGIFRTDLLGNCLYVNERWCKITGMKQSEALAGGWARAMHPDDRERVAQAWYTSKHAQLNFILEYRIQRPDGVVRWVLGQATAERNPAGELAGYIGTITDITQIKQSEEALRKSETKHRTLYDSTTDAVMLLDEKGFFDCNKSTLAMFGCATREEFCSKHPADLSPPVQPDGTDSLSLANRQIDTALKNGSNSFEWMHKRADTGKVFPADVLLSAMELDGKLVLQATVRDISERKQMEAVKQEALGRLQKITQLVPGIVYQFRLRPDGSACVPYASEATREIYRLDPEEIREDASKVFTTVYPDDLENFAASIQASARDLTPWQHEYRLKFDDGTVRWLYGNALPQREADGSTLWHGFLTDITVRKKSEERIQQSEERLRAYLENISDTIWLINLNLDVGYVSPSVMCMLGMLPEELIGRPSSLVIHPDDMDIISGAMGYVMEHPGEPRTIKYRVSHKDGRWIYVESTGINMLGNPAICGVLVTMRDITERKQAEDALRESESSMRAILDNSPYLVWLKDTEGRYITSNNAHANYVRLKTPSEITGKTDFDLWTKELAEKYRADDAEVMASRLQKRVEEQSIDGDRMHWVETYKTPVIDESGNVLGTTGFAIDITERKLVEEALLRSEKKFRTLFDSTSDMVMMMDEKGFFDANKAALEGTGCVTVEDFCSRHPADLSPPEQPGGTSSLILANQHIATAMEKGYHRFEWAMKRVDNGKIFPAELTLTAMDMDGKRFLQVVVRDITERKQVEEQIHNLAFYDTLTQLPNRRMLNDRMNQAMASSKRSGHYGALLFLDLDNFKPLNDNYGHMVGDLLLKEVARRISSCVREMDTVARFGGDEFVVMLTELFADKTESAAQAGIVAEKIRITLAETYLLKVQQGDKAETTVEHHCTSSIGVVLFINHKDSPEDIIKWADLAMYRAKDDGRNLIRFHDSKG
jgi:diguanylate cyclase (GGDEF)-like protein/PAS domain S-box-containing protein